MEKVLDAGHPDFFIEINPDHFELRSRDAVCPYLAEDYSCTIHEMRPPACRAWPVHACCEGGGREYLLMDCPIVDKLSDKELGEMMAQAGSIPEENIVNSFKLSRLSKEEIELIEKRFRMFKCLVLK
jgi:Fe-S-cluster containining protein